MGVAITELVPTKEIQLDDLKGKTLAVDGYNVLYQFLTTIRGPDGTPLSDSHGNVTSHLTGLFSRCTNLMGKGIRLIFVFDGKVPDLKRQEIERRRALKTEAHTKYEEAKEAKDEEGMKKYAGRTAVLTREMVTQAKELLDALGIPWLDAPSEGEAQAAALVKQGHAWAVVSQDTDALLYEAPRVLKNLAVTGRRKVAGKLAYNTVEPELIEIKEVHKELGLDTAQLRVLAVLVGTDYDIGGIKGIGPKKGLKLVQEHGHDFDAVFSAVKWEEYYTIPWKEILQVFEQMPVIDPGTVKFGKIDAEKVERVLVEEHDFSRERVAMALERLLKEQANTQRGLGDWS
jgi:flap endonuclease-1